MFEKDLNVGFLLDFYGDILSDHKRDVLCMYYNEDLSLAEISEVIGISRQGVRDIIKKAGSELLFYEEKLGFAKRFKDLKKTSDRIAELCCGKEIPAELKLEIEKLSKLLQ
jgi:predicted DNA-binding protein YlxM (UPF0122 family)